MLEALWTAEFVSSAGIFGTGVVVLESGNIFGGDNQYYYIGAYEVSGPSITADLEITHFAGPGHSALGPAAILNLRLTGQINQPTMELRGNVVEAPERQIVVRLTRRQELP